MARDLDLKRRLEHFGLTVIEIPGWQTRGSDTLDPQGAINHHTAGPSPAHGVAPSLGTVINGRPDLAGPLANTFLGRDLVVRLIAAGKANHAGVGVWRGVTGNSHLLGCEVEHTGLDNEPISAALIEAMARVQAAHAWGLFGSEMVAQHCEYATPHGRKPDFCCSRLDEDGFRARVGHLLAHADTPGAPPLHTGIDLGPPPVVPATLVYGGSHNDPAAVRYLQRILNTVLPAWGQAFHTPETGVFDISTRLGLIAFKKGANDKQWQHEHGHVTDRLFDDPKDDRAGKLTLRYGRVFAALG